MSGMTSNSYRRIAARLLPLLAVAGAAALHAQSDSTGPQLIGSTAALTFNMVAGGASSVAQQTLVVTSSGAAIAFAAVGAPLTASNSAQWLSVSPLMNTTPATLT